MAASSRAGQRHDLKTKPTLVRVHSECLTGDVFGSRRCDCGNQLHAALQQISEEGNGVLVYMRQEGRGIGLAAKIHAYKLQEEGLDTVEANAKLGFGSDLRDYGLGAQILFDLGVRQFRFLTNNPKKVVGLEGYGLEMVEQVPIRSEANPHNARYLETKKIEDGALVVMTKAMTNATCVPGDRYIVTSLHGDLTIQHLIDLTSRSHSPFVCASLPVDAVIRHF